MMRALANNFEGLCRSKRAQDLYCHTPGLCNCEPQSGDDFDLGVPGAGILGMFILIKMIAACVSHIRLCGFVRLQTKRNGGSCRLEWRRSAVPNSLVSAPSTALKRAGSVAVIIDVPPAKSGC